MNWLSNVVGAVWEIIARSFIGHAGSGRMRAAAFVRYTGAMGAGHLGWGFDFDAANADVGAVENPIGAASCPADKMGYWDEITGAPAHVMQSRGYDDLKYVHLANGDAVSAYRVAKWVSRQPYALFGRNCMDDAYDVLRAYGVPNLPVPSHEILPNEWFVQFLGDLVPVDSFVWTKERATSVRVAITKLAMKTAPAKIPTWRTPGHADWHELHQRMLQSSAG